MKDGFDSMGYGYMLVRVYRPNLHLALKFYVRISNDTFLHVYPQPQHFKSKMLTVDLSRLAGMDFEG